MLLSLARISAATGLEVPPPISGIYGKDPALKAAANQERVAGFLSELAGLIGSDAKPASEPQGKPASDPPSEPADAPESQPPGEDGHADDDEQTFAGHPLSYFDGMSDEEIGKVDRVGPATLAKIKAAQKTAK